MDAFASLVDRGSHGSHSPQSNSTAGPHQNSTGDRNAQLAAKHQEGNNMLVAWLALQLVGQVTLPILILTMLFHKRISRRNPTIINLCIVWTLATIPPLLLFYAGKHVGSMPGPMLCLFQAATYSGVAPMAAMAYLSVVIHACTVVHEIINASTVRPFAFDLRMILLLSSPYITFFTFALLVAIVGAQNTKDLKRSLFFCEVENHDLSLPIFGFTLIVVMLTLICQFWIAIMFYRNWLAKRRGKVSTHQDVSSVDIQLLIRMVAFTVFEIVIVVSTVSTIMNPRMGAAKVLSATPPFAVFLIFASSPDIFNAWFPCCYCCRRKSPEPLTYGAPRTPLGSILDSVPSEKDVVAHPLAHMRAAQENKARDVDLEKGTTEFAPQWASRPEHGTTMTMFPGSSGQQSPLAAIRAFRTPAGPRGARSKDNQI